MTPKQRVLSAVEFKPVDVPPVEYNFSTAGLHEHGQPLLDLWKAHPQDFGPYRRLDIPHPLPGTVDAQGRYYSTWTDPWGVLWEYRIFGINGHPLRRPLDDWANLATYTPPAPPVIGSEEFLHEKARIDSAPEFFYKAGWVNIFEVMCAVRKFEDVLMDVATDSPELHRLAEMILENRLANVDHLVATGYDAIQVADDWGTQGGLLISRQMWRNFFQPLYRPIVDRIHKAGKRAFYHLCGQCDELLDDLAETGFDAIWPQLPLYDAKELAHRSRKLGLAVALHPDRGHLMTSGTPSQVRSEVLRIADTFRVGEGGSWMYIEIDNGFPMANIQALIETVAKLRRG